MHNTALRIALLSLTVALAACGKQSGMTTQDFGPDADADGHVAATGTSARANAAVATELALDDTAAFEDARRGFVATDDPLVTTTATGTGVWNRPSYDFITGPRRRA